MNKKKKITFSIIKRLLSYMIRSWYLVIVAIGLTLISNQLSLLGPKYSGETIDAIACKDGIDLAVVGDNVTKMLFCYIASAITCDYDTAQSESSLHNEKSIV